MRGIRSTLNINMDYIKRQMLRLPRRDRAWTLDWTMKHVSCRLNWPRR